MVVDHHKIDNFRTNEPIYYKCEPVGCTATLIYDIYNSKKDDVVDSFEINILLLSAILSDTLLLKSPTTTEKDIEVANTLAEKLNIDLLEYGYELLKAGADLSDVNADELIKIDAKEFDCNGKKIEIAQINAVDMDNVLNRQNEIEESMKNVIKLRGLDAFLVAVTDVINCNSEIIVLGDRTDIIEKAFNIKLNNNRAFLEGVVSRKKQLAPKIQDASK